MSKEHDYAYEAGYRDGSINYELEHCPACKNVADLQEALAKNAKLREEFNKMDVWHSKELTAAMDENAKLRELVRELWAQAEQNLVCDDNCPYGAACDWKDCVFERLMRELGVEVDG